MNSHRSQITVDLQRSIDELCDQAESVWRGGGIPDVAQLVYGISGDALDSLLTELINVDLELNNRSLEEMRVWYHSRLPDHEELIEKAIESIVSREQSVAADVRCEKSDTEFDSETYVGKRIGSYLVTELISVGGFGVVYKALDEVLQRPVVIKVPKNIRYESAEIDTFLDEARKAANLTHQNVIRIYHVGVDAGLPFIVEEFVAGGDLKQLLLRERLSTRRTVEIVRSIVSGVSCAHRAGIIHRDLKPSNILINSAGEPVVADFGLATRVQSGSAGQIAGTVRYMSPEQIRGESDRLDQRSDVWSIGVMLFEMLTGRLPQVTCHECGSDDSTHYSHIVDADLERIQNKELRDICSKCLQNDVTNRYQSAADLWNDLVSCPLRVPRKPLQSVASHIPGMIFRHVLHSDGRDEVTYASPEIRPFLNFKSKDLPNRTSMLWKRMHADDLGSYKKKIEQSAQTLERFFAEFRVLTPKNGIRWFQESSQPERLENGDVVWDSVVLDITDWNESRKASQEVNSKVEQITSKVPGMIFQYVLHPDGSDEVTYVSARVREFFNLEPEDVIEDMSRMWNRIHPDDLGPMLKQVHRSADKLEHFFFEYRIDTPDRGRRLYQTNSHPARLENGDVVWDGVVLDITDQKESSIVLQNEDTGLKNVTFNAPGMFFQHVLNSDGSHWMNYVSSQSRELFEVEPEAAMADVNLLLARVHPGDIAWLKEMTMSFYETLRQTNFEFRVVLPKRGVRWLHSVSQPSRKTDGSVVCDGVITDITEKKTTCRCDLRRILPARRNKAKSMNRFQ